AHAHEDEHLQVSTRTRTPFEILCNRMKAAQHQVGLYYLWPAERIFPTGAGATAGLSILNQKIKNGYDSKHYVVDQQQEVHIPRHLAGMFEEKAFFEFMHKMETKFKTRYPAPANLYRQLCGKLYYKKACRRPEFRVPATVYVKKPEVEDHR
ncbi:unnamed protein product, partial [Amoebophrya sp. A25]